MARHSDDDNDDDHGKPHRKGCETKDGKARSKDEREHEHEHEHERENTKPKAKKKTQKAHTPRAASHSTPSAAACTACAGAGPPRARARAPSRPERGSAGTRRSPFPARAEGWGEGGGDRSRQSVTSINNSRCRRRVCSRGRLAHRWKSRSPEPRCPSVLRAGRGRGHGPRPTAHVAGQGARGEARGKGQWKTKDWRLTSLCQRVTACASCSKM